MARADKVSRSLLSAIGISAVRLAGALVEILLLPASKNIFDDAVPDAVL
jgi:hypothetical protein